MADDLNMSGEGSIMKNGLVCMDFKEFNTLNERVL
jgi:hypothetical protein